MNEDDDNLKLISELDAAIVRTVKTDMMHYNAANKIRRLIEVENENKSLRQIIQDFPPIEAELRTVSDRLHQVETQHNILFKILKDAVEQPFITEGSDWWARVNKAIKMVEEFFKSAKDN